MASFVESATLVVKDSSTAPINKINAALKKLQATAKSLKSIKIDIKVNDAGIKKATASLRQFQQQLKLSKSAGSALRMNVNTGSLKSATSAVRGMTSAMKTLNTAARIRVNTGGIAQARNQLNALRAAARRPIAVNTQAGAGGGRLPPPGGRRALPAPGAPAGPSMFGRLAGATGRIVVDLSQQSLRALGRATLHATKEGYDQADIAQTKMGLRQMGPEERTATAEAVDRIQADQRASKSGMFFNRAQTQSLYAESLGITNADPKAAEHLMGQAIALAKTGYAVNQSFEQARTGALDFIKTGEQMGKLTDLTTGAYDPAKAEKYFDAMRLATIQVGEEFTGQRWRTMVQSMGPAKYGQDTKGIITSALLMEEMGSRAGTGMQMALKNLTGNVLTKKKVQNLEKMGLLTTEESKVGSVGGQSIMEIVGKNAKNEEELRSNFAGWISGTVLPKARAMGLMPKLDEKTGQPEREATAKEVGRLSEMITSGKGTDIMTGVLKNIIQLEKSISQAVERKGDVATTEETLAGSGRLAYKGVETELQDVMGQIAKKADPIMLPLAKGLSSTMSDIADKAATGKIGGTDILKALAAGGGALAGVGLTSGMRALASSNPAIQSLGAAGVSLQGAAAALTAAAALQSSALGSLATAVGAASRFLLPAAALAATLMPQPAGGPSNLPDLEKINDANAALEKAVGELSRAQEAKADPAEIARLSEQVTAANKAVAAAATAAGDKAVEPAKLSPADMERRTQIAGLNDQLGQTKTELAKLNEVRPDVQQLNRERDARAKGLPTEREQKKFELTTQLRAIEAEIARASVKPVVLPPEWKPVAATPLGKGVDDLLRVSSYKTLDAAANNLNTASTSLTSVATQYMAAPGKADIGFAQPWSASAATAAAAAEPPPAATPAEAAPAATPWADPSAIQGAADSLSSAFSSGASSIESAGGSIESAASAAAGTLQGAAPGIGASIGAAAAAAISAAAANVHINVSTSGGGADTGSQKAAP